MQEFNKWARRLLTYSRVPERDVDLVAMEEWRVRERGEEGSEGARTANELNGFRRKVSSSFESLSLVFLLVRVLITGMNSIFRDSRSSRQMMAILIRESWLLDRMRIDILPGG